MPSAPARRRKPAADYPGILAAPLRNFQLCDLNVRTQYDAAHIRSMAESIAIHGLKQNLVCIALPGGKLGVVAGGCRLRALWQLKDADRIDDGHLVPYAVESASTAREASLAENIERAALNPADEFEAFAQIVADHHAEPDPIAYCAGRFGVTRRHVEQQLRLADLAPDILEALRRGHIDVGAAKAYAVFGNHEAQLDQFAQEERREFGGRHQPANIRNAMKGRTYRTDCPQAVYVGLPAYLAAGGRADQVMFMGVEDGERLLDPAILDRLTREKAELALPARAAEDGLAKGLLTIGFQAPAAWPRPPATHMQRPGLYPEQVDPAIRAASIGVYTLAPDGLDLMLSGLMTPIRMPASPAPAETVTRARADVPPAPAAETPPAPAAIAPTPELTRWTPPAPAGRCAPGETRLPRAGDILRRAALMAARRIATDALPADRIVLADPAEALPADIEQLADGDVLVTVQVRVHADELEAMRPAAEASIGEAAHG